MNKFEKILFFKKLAIQMANRTHKWNTQNNKSNITLISKAVFSWGKWRT